MYVVLPDQLLSRRQHALTVPPSRPLGWTAHFLSLLHNNPSSGSAVRSSVPFRKDTSVASKSGNRESRCTHVLMFAWTEVSGFPFLSAVPRFSMFSLELPTVFIHSPKR